MSDIVVNKAGLPFLLGGAADLAVHLGSINPLQPLPDTAAAVFDVSVNGGGTAPLTIGGAGSCTIALKAGARAALRIVRPGSPQAADYGLSGFFAAHPDWLALLLDVGANAAGTFDARVGYAGLTASTTLQASTDARFSYANVYPRNTPVTNLLPAFFGAVRVPARVRDTPGPGEVSRLEFGGSLQLGLQIGAGFQLKGVPSLDVGSLVLSERYDLSVIGTLGLSASVSGVFSVDVRGATGADGAPAANWARVVVRRSRSDAFAIAGDVKVSAAATLQGAPENPDEFLGAVLGVNAKNWLHVLERVTTLTDPAQLQAEIDRLAMHFVGEWTGEAIDTLDKAGLGRILARARLVVDQYNGLENSVVSTFDRYFDQLTSPALGGRIARAIESIAHLPSWRSLDGEIDPLVWRLITQLTDGDPLAWILTREVSQVQARAQKVLDLISSTAHSELRQVIGLVKRRFGLDPLFHELDGLDTIAKLKAAAGTRAGAFIERLTGAAIERLDQGKVEALRQRLHLVLTNAQAFEQTAYAKFTQALTETASFALHAEYSRAGVDDALVDVAINVATAEGRQLLQACALGDFSRALGGNRADLVRLNEGHLVHRVTAKHAVAVTVAGWQKAFRYSSVDQLIVEADQRIVTESNGSVTAYTTLSLDKVNDRRRNGERTLTNLLIRFVGESRGVLTSAPGSEQFLVDAITGMSARYQLSYEDDRTSGAELAHYLSFAGTIGLDQPALQPEALRRLLPVVGPDNFGPTSLQYDVRYGDAGLRALFGGQFDEAGVRQTIRRIVLASYLNQGGELASVGWSYWTGGVYDLWRAGQAVFVKPGTQQYSPIQASPFPAMPAPPSAQVSHDRQELLSALYFIEDDLTGGFRALHDLVSSGAPVAPPDFERALGGFGRALDRLDRFDESENGAFAVFDDLQRRAAPDAPRESSLTLTSCVNGQPVTKVFLA
jgi:hypothetical protein